MRGARSRVLEPRSLAGQVGALLLLLLPTTSFAVPPLETLWLTPDSTLSLSNIEVRDQQAVADDLGGALTTVSLGSLPEDSALDALHASPDGTVLFSLESWADLGGLPTAPADLVSWDGSSYSIAFDSRANGIPAGVDVDAATTDGDELLLSFDTFADLPGGPYGDDDVVRWDGAAFSLAFDGSAAGVPAALDIDGVHLLSNGLWLISFDAHGEVGGIALADEDVVVHDPGSGSWEMFYDASAVDPAWTAADAKALTVGEAPNILEIPTLSPFGLLLLAVILTLAAGAILGRRHRPTPKL